MSRLKFDFLEHDQALQANAGHLIVEIYRENLFFVVDIINVGKMCTNIGQFEYLEDAIKYAQEWYERL